MVALRMGQVHHLHIAHMRLFPHSMSIPVSLYALFA